MTRIYQAKQFEAPQETEVSGVLLHAYLHNVERQITEPILTHYGFTLESIDAEKWYPSQMFLNIEHSIYAKNGGNIALIAVGKSAVENDIPSAGISTLNEAIEALPSVYTTHQRNLPKGYGWLVEQKGARHYVFTNNTGTTNHGAYGYIWTLCMKMRPANTSMMITPLQGFEHNSPDPAIIDIQW